MTRKEKEIFQQYRDVSATKLTEAFVSRNEDSIHSAMSEFMTLTNLWDKLNNIIVDSSEVGA